MIAPVLDLAGVSKDYRGLRPLRIHHLTVAAGERVAIVGLDGPMAEVFVNLVTGASVPDCGEVKVFGHSTAAIVDSAQWLTVVDRFGIVSERAVLLDQLTVIQNLAIPFTLDIEPPPAEVQRRAGDLAREVGVPEAAWSRPIAELDAASRVRLRLGRALALDPAVLLLEHVSAGLAPAEAAALGADLRAIAMGPRAIAVVAATADEMFARAVASRVLRWEPGTGRLTEHRGGRWFGGLLGQ